MHLDFQIAGLLTLVLAGAGSAAALAGWYLLRRSEARVGKKMRHYLFAHSALLLITMLFGGAGVVHASQGYWHALYYIRAAILLLESFYLVTLIREFYNIEKQP